MFWCFTALGILVFGGLAAALVRQPAAARCLGAASCVAGCLAGLVPAAGVLTGGRTLTSELPWTLPHGALRLELDPLSALFAAAILGLSALASVYGAEYLAHSGSHASHGDPVAVSPALPGLPWLHYNLLVAGMFGVVLARNGLLFLLAWEVMSLASFFLVVHDSHLARSREAGWTYLVATHLGTAFLLAFFLVLGREAGSLDFARFPVRGSLEPSTVSLLLALALVGFGTKAGLVPLHVWLPEAHPAAPSHVSAVMSGVMIKTGVYGLLRALVLVGPGPRGWAWVFIGAGAVSMLYGVLFALSQRELKRVLAYSSVENVGVILLGTGLGLLGLETANAPAAVAGFAGALLHVVNHAAAKGLLFLGAGSVLHGAGTGDLERLGGLLRRLPRTGASFFVGAAALSALPPLGCFTSEFLVYLSAYRGLVLGGPSAAVPSIVAIAVLALAGGLAAACFVRLVGVVFLGEPRGPEAAGAHEAGLAMTLTQRVLAAVCVILGLSAPILTAGLGPVLQPLMPDQLSGLASGLSLAAEPLTLAVRVALGTLLAAALLIGLVKFLMRGRSVEAGSTWGCGYSFPSSGMQYTASSFSRPLTESFDVLLRSRREAPRVDGLFPAATELATSTPDLCTSVGYGPFFRGLSRALLSFRRLQHGRLQSYILYLLLTLVGLLAWLHFTVR